MLVSTSSLARATASLAEAGPQDAVLITLKAHQLRDVLPGLRELFGPRTMVVTMINGIPWWYFHALGGPHDGRGLDSVDPGGRIAAAIEPQRIIGSIVYPASELLEPGVVKVIEGNRFTIGELDGERSERIDALSQAMMRAGFKAPVSRDIRSELWIKLWGNLSFNPISALTHATLEDICRFPASRALAAGMMAEAQQVAEALGVRFRISLDQRIAGAEAVGAHKTSMLQDVEAGRALELEARYTHAKNPNDEAAVAAVSAAVLAATVTGCANNRQPYDYTAFKQSRPASILVIPPLNNSPDVAATYSMLSQVTLPLAEAGYYVFPVSLVDETFRAELEARLAREGRLPSIATEVPASPHEVSAEGNG